MREPYTIRIFVPDGDQGRSAGRIGSSCQPMGLVPDISLGLARCGLTNPPARPPWPPPRWHQVPGPIPWL